MRTLSFQARSTRTLLVCGLTLSWGWGCGGDVERASGDGDGDGDGPAVGTSTGGRTSDPGTGGRSSVPGTGGVHPTLIASGGAPVNDGLCAGESSYACQEDGQVAVTLGEAEPVVLDHPGTSHNCEGKVRLGSYECRGHWDYSLSAHADGESGAGGAGGAGGAAPGEDDEPLSSIDLTLSYEGEQGPFGAETEGGVGGYYKAPLGKEWLVRASFTLLESESPYSLQIVGEATDSEGNVEEVSISVQACPGRYLACAF